MPGKRPGITNRVTKPTPPPNARRGSSLSSAAQEQLEQFAQQVNTTDNHDVHDLEVSDTSIEGPHDLNASNMLTNGSIATFHPGLPPVLGPEPTFEVAIAEDQVPQTAADIAYGAYGDLVKIDSALCKKLATEEALREPIQRRHDQKLNIERRSNVEALLAHVTGQVPTRPCKNCHKGHGPWTECVIYDGQMCGSCTNCWFNASGSRCTFHENNHPQPQSYIPQVAVAPPPPPPPAITYQPAPIPQPSPTPMHIAPLIADVSHWKMSDQARLIVTKALGEAKTYNRGKRLATRVQLAAKELAMRVAEFDEYCQSPEGIAEMQYANMQSQQSPESPFDDDEALHDDDLS